PDHLDLSQYPSPEDEPLFQIVQILEDLARLLSCRDADTLDEGKGSIHRPETVLISGHLGKPPRTLVYGLEGRERHPRSLQLALGCVCHAEPRPIFAWVGYISFIQISGTPGEYDIRYYSISKISDNRPEKPSWNP